MKLRPVRIGLWDRYGGSTESGWMRWLLERFEVPFTVVYANALDARDRFGPGKPVSFDGEVADGRVARRKEKWTPAELV